MKKTIKFKINDKVRTNKSNKMCSYLHNQTGIIKEMVHSIIDGELAVVVFDNQNLRSLEDREPMESCRLPFDCLKKI